MTKLGGRQPCGDIDARIQVVPSRHRVERRLDELLCAKMRRRASGEGEAGAPTPALAQSQLQRFLARQIDESFAVEDLTRMAGGGSNAAYSFTLRRSGRTERMVLRVKQPGTIETFVPREFQMLRAVHGHFPVPQAHWVTDDPAEFGAPALVCGFMPGVQAPPIDRPMATGMGISYGENLRPILAPQFVALEARLHAHDWSTCDLSHFDRPRAGTTDAIDWRLALWDRTWEEDLYEEHPTMLLAREWLHENRPVVDHVSLLHGDFRNGNFLFDPKSGQITALLDWELCSLGDRHCDLGYTMLTAWGHVAADGKFMVANLLDTESFIHEYERISGLPVDVDRLRYYVVFNTYWSAVALLATGLRNAQARLTQLDVMYNVIAGKGGFDIGELNRFVLEA